MEDKSTAGGSKTLHGILLPSPQLEMLEESVTKHHDYNSDITGLSLSCGGEGMIHRGGKT